MAVAADFSGSSLIDFTGIVRVCPIRLGVLSVENGGHVAWFWRLKCLAKLVTEMVLAED